MGLAPALPGSPFISALPSLTLSNLGKGFYYVLLTIKDSLSNILGTDTTLFSATGRAYSVNEYTQINSALTSAHHDLAECEQELTTSNQTIASQDQMMEAQDQQINHNNLGDLDVDGDVDAIDLGTISQYFGNEQVDIDNDGDNFAEIDGVCDDANINVSPEAKELCNDGIDNNCDGRIDESGCQ